MPKTAKRKITLKAKAIDSMKDFKKSLKSKVGGYIQNIPEDGITGRFMDEPTGWVEYLEHYDETRDSNWYFPCSDDCEGCDAGLKATKRFLANFIDTEENKVVPLKIPVSVATILRKFYERYQTLLDRDYFLSKEGSGFDTTYSAIPEAPSRMKLDKYDSIDLWALLESQLADGDDDDDDDEPLPEPKSKKSKTKDKPKAKTTPPTRVERTIPRPKPKTSSGRALKKR